MQSVSGRNGAGQHQARYWLQLQSVNSAELAFVVATEFGQTLQDAGVKIVVVDNDKKAHSKTVADACDEVDIKVCPGAGQVYDRTLISDFTGEDGEKLGGYPVNSPDAMVQDQSVNNT